MTPKICNISFLLPRILFAFAFLILSQLEISAQSQVVSNIEQVLPPSEENFEEAGDLIVPWRETGCYRGNLSYKEPDCIPIKDKEFLEADTLSIYDEKGALWYHFSLTPRKSDYLLKNKKNGFLPLAIPGLTINPYQPTKVILRLVRQSAHWYEVEINEDTKATEFVLKSDPSWAKTNWSYWLYYWTNLKIDGTKVKLLDKPEGQTIESSADLVLDTVLFLKTDGDWAYVKGFSNNTEHFGWIRWRIGREILVGCIFNDFKIPEAKKDDNVGRRIELTKRF
jgi:hypothetical protein